MSGNKKTHNSSIPGWMGKSLPLVGNPYTLTKKVYHKAVKPVAQGVEPYFMPLVGVAGKVVKPVAGPILNSVNLGTFAPLSTDPKGNSTIIVHAEGSNVQKVIGGKVAEEQEFDVFMARVVETVKGIKRPEWSKRG